LLKTYYFVKHPFQQKVEQKVEAEGTKKAGGSIRQADNQAGLFE
jgi:hypothetical protein